MKNSKKALLCLLACALAVTGCKTQKEPAVADNAMLVRSTQTLDSLYAHYSAPGTTFAPLKHLITNKTNEMKKGIHPENYRLVAFKDMSNDHVFLCRSAVSTKETIEVNGETYPVYKMEISNTSHPFYTGKMKLVDTAGRVDKFMSRYAKRYDKKNAK